MKNRIKKIDISTLSPLILFTVFSLCVITVLLTGAKVYQNSSRSDRASYDRRTVAQYLTTRIRQSDRSGGCFVGNFESTSPLTEGDTFFSCSESRGELYHLRIYCYDGYLYELLTLAGEEFEPRDGEKIIEAKSVTFRTNGNTVEISIVYPDGTGDTISILLRSESEAIE